MLSESSGMALPEGWNSMALRFTGKEGTNEAFEKMLEAYDGDKRVVVITSTEAIEDNGLAAVQSRADEKYVAGQLDEKGRVRVLTIDF